MGDRAPTATVTYYRFVCKHCDHPWDSQQNPPTYCPKCKTANWHKPKVVGLGRPKMVAKTKEVKA